MTADLIILTPCAIRDAFLGRLSDEEVEHVAKLIAGDEEAYAVARQIGPHLKPAQEACERHRRCWQQLMSEVVSAGPVSQLSSGAVN